MELISFLVEEIGPFIWQIECHVSRSPSQSNIDSWDSSGIEMVIPE